DIGDTRIGEVPLPAVTVAINKVPVSELREQGPNNLVCIAMRAGGISGPRVRAVDDADRRVSDQRLDHRHTVTGQRSVRNARPVTLPGRRIPHPHAGVAGPGRGARVAVIKLWTTD